MVSYVNQREETLKLFLQCKIHPITLIRMRLDVLQCTEGHTKLNHTIILVGKELQNQVQQLT